MAHGTLGGFGFGGFGWAVSEREWKRMRQKQGEQKSTGKLVGRARSEAAMVEAGRWHAVSGRCSEGCARSKRAAPAFAALSRLQDDVLLTCWFLLSRKLLRQSVRYMRQHVHVSCWTRLCMDQPAQLSYHAAPGFSPAAAARDMHFLGCNERVLCAWR